MAKLSKITGSIIVASLLFSMTGCGDDDTKSNSKDPITQNDDKSKTALSQADRNQITRNIQNDNLTAGDITAQTIASIRKITNADGSPIQTGRELLIYLSEGDEAKLQEIKDSSEEDI